MVRQAIEQSQRGRHRAPTIIIIDKWDKRNIRGYLCEASRQAPAREGAASHQAPTDENGNLRGASHLAPTGEGAASRQAPTEHSEACHSGDHSAVSHRHPQ